MSVAARNETVDYVRGVAILIVMITHVIEVNVDHFFTSLLFNIIWSVQMPMFMLISGYCSKYSKPIDSGKALLAYLSKRTLTYLLPWVVWTIGVKGILLGKVNLITYIQYILYNMDAGYWFLATLWTICVIFGLSSHFSNKVSKKVWIRVFACLCFSVVGGVFLLAIGAGMGMTFLGIKLTVYYLPFFLLGYLYGEIEKSKGSLAWFKNIKQFAILPMIVIYILIILKFDLYAGAETLLNIAIRIAASVCGSVVIISAVSHYQERISSKARNMIMMFGRLSLEWYVSHILFTSTIDIWPLPEFLSLTGIEIITVDFAFMFFFSWVLIFIANSNRWCRLTLFGKR